MSTEISNLVVLLQSISQYLYRYGGLFQVIFASIDRVLITSSKVTIRQRSNLRLSYIYLIIGTVFWLLFHSPAWFFTTITEVNENNFMCFYEIGSYLVFISFYSIIKESSSIILLILFGLWAVKNIRRLHRVTLPTISLQSRINRAEGTYKINPKDQQFVSMVLIDIIIFSICSSMAAIFLTHQQITQYENKSFEQIQISIFLKEITVFCLHIPFSTSCYTNLIVSKAYRKAMKNVFLCN
ncbi:unnamed protein product [Adineta ricciae]|uniref:G-protein coupled receptors family 1 profile domain-containing protein n=1 Tax=Adineta ricciae TaxID=249248 RepID=A0A815WX15_ADIRI|nr:unnamed protein product [Adineta ricciae]